VSQQGADCQEIDVTQGIGPKVMGLDNGAGRAERRPDASDGLRVSDQRFCDWFSLRIVTKGGCDMLQCHVR
jgi:hypothetical protein